MVLKLESPMLSCVDQATATEETPAKPRSSRNKSKTTASSSTATSSESSNTNSRKRAAADPTDKEAKARERVLRNRAAAQESRDKKRKYVADIEASNDTLQQENTQLLKRLKTVESDNLALSQRLEALTAQFAQMQQLLSQSVKQTQPGVGFCQSAVLAKKDKKPRHQDILTNSQQQKLAPTQKSLYTTTSTPAAMPDKHRQVYSMTMMNSMSKKRLQNREARSLDRNAAQNRMETSCRPFCNHLTSCCNRTLTLSSSVAASFPTTRPSTTRQEFQATTALMMMVFLTNILPQLMLNFSTLFLISTGARSSNPQELQLQQVVLSFIQRQQLFWSRRLFRNGGPLHQGLTPQQQQPSAFFLTQSGTIKDTITSLDPSAIEEIVTEFRAGHRDVARGLLVKAFLSSRTNMMRLDKDKGDDDKVKKEWIRLLRKK
ncbi:hypothetical protein EDD11_001399 [Mortierella claussenii]|nr:hypothetical protein EDD11_001399 [Mortierella claussenii]